MTKVSCIFHIRNGEITNKTVVRKMFEKLKDGRYKVDISKYNTRSLDQNSYYWLILTDYIQPALYDLGWRDIKEKEDAHDFLRDMFLKDKSVNDISGDTRTRIKSTTELTTVQFNEYLEEIWQWGAEYLGITIPEPNTQIKANYESTQ